MPNWVMYCIIQTFVVWDGRSSDVPHIVLSLFEIQRSFLPVVCIYSDWCNLLQFCSLPQQFWCQNDALKSGKFFFGWKGNLSKNTFVMYLTILSMKYFKKLLLDFFFYQRNAPKSVCISCHLRFMEIHKPCLIWLTSADALRTYVTFSKLFYDGIEQL